jgi:SAM-dependent methyltransferase
VQEPARAGDAEHRAFGDGGGGFGADGLMAGRIERLAHGVDLDEALAGARALCERHADWAEPWRLAGSLHKDLGQSAAAVTALERAQALEPGPLAAWLLAGLRGAHDADAPPLPPDGYVEALFDGYAADFDRHLETLEYRAPELLLPGLVARRYATALDLGCGTGVVGRLVRPLAQRLEGLDVSTAMIERARATGVYDALHAAELLAHLRQQPAGSLDLVLAALPALVADGVQFAVQGTGEVEVVINGVGVAPLGVAGAGVGVVRVRGVSVAGLGLSAQGTATTQVSVRMLDASGLLCIVQDGDSGATLLVQDSRAVVAMVQHDGSGVAMVVEQERPTVAVVVTDVSILPGA